VHRDASLLLLFGGVKVSQLTSQLGGDDTVRADKTVGQRGLAVVNMGQDTEIPDVTLRVLQRGNIARVRP
jgi:hypothetical protein